MLVGKPALRVLCLVAGITPLAAHAKPIAFRDGSTFMGEYGGETMQELQFFYAPAHWYSVGGGQLRLEADDETFSREITYARINFLAKRWNLPRAQGNVFAWGGLGSASSSETDERLVTPNFGAQADYETLRFYGSGRFDWHGNTAFTHRIDTLQLGWAPYPHDYDTLATWLLIQGRHYTGGIMDGIETAALVRFFKGNVWVEAGVTNNGELQAMFMLNF